MSMSETVVVLIFIVMAITIVLLALALAGASARATAGDITNYRTARRMASATFHSDMSTTRDSSPIAELLCTVTAYSPTVAQTDSNPLITASGKRVYVGGVAADLSRFPFGTILLIPGYNNGNPCTVVDTGSAIKGNKLDVFFFSTDEAVHWGRRRNVKVQVLYVPLP